MSLLSNPLCQPFEFPEGEHGVLLIHGFTGSPAHMRLLGEKLHSLGFAVRGIRLPGHGDTPESMARSTAKDWAAASLSAAEDMRRQYRFVSVCGLSMGGVLALLIAEAGKADACVTISAPMKTINRLRVFSPLIAPFHPMMNKRADARRSVLNQDYDLGYDRTPTACYHELSLLMRQARAGLSRIQCPLLAVQARDDRVVTPDSPRIILEGASSRVKEQLWLETGTHVCTISPEYPRIAEAMARFLRRTETAGWRETARP